jgi:uncharacterized protein with HEPN domain
MLDAIRAIKDFTRGMDKETFLKDEKTKSAVIHQLLVLGETSKAIPQDIKLQAPDLGWKGMAGMRDRLVHAYFNVDYNLVWDAIENRIPRAEVGLEKLIEEIKSSS